MAYRVVKNPRAWWPVKWDGVGEDGEIVRNQIELRFRRLKVDAAAEFMRDVSALRSLEVAEAVDLPQLYAEAVAHVAGDWRGVEAENGEALRWDVPDGWYEDRDPEGKRKPLVAPNLRTLLNEPGLFVAIFDAFLLCMKAEPEIRVGN